MPGLGVDGSGFIEESSTAAMSDTTLECKFQKAGVPRHIGTQGVGHGLEGAEACRIHAALEAALQSLALLDLEQASQPGLGQEFLGVGEQAEEAELAQAALQFLKGDDRCRGARRAWRARDRGTHLSVHRSSPGRVSRTRRGRADGPIPAQ